MIVTVADIQSMKTNFDQNLADNRIRKSWVLQMPEHIKQKYRVIPQQARFAMYRELDKAVRDKWVSLMKAHYADAIANGAKTIKGTPVLEKGWQINTDELLIDAAASVVAETVEWFATEGNK